MVCYGISGVVNYTITSFHLHPVAPSITFYAPPPPPPLPHTLASRDTAIHIFLIRILKLVHLRQV